MQEIISAVTLVATLFAGTVVADKIYHAAQKATLTKANLGLPRQSPFATTAPYEPTRLG